MGWAERARQRHRLGNISGRDLLNKLIRAEIPGGSNLLDAAAPLMREADNPRADRHPSHVAAIRRASRAVTNVLDELRTAIIEGYRETDAVANEPAKKETHSASSASSVSFRSTPPSGATKASLPAAADRSFPSTPHAKGATPPEISLAKLPTSSEIYRTPMPANNEPVDPRTWRPSMPQVESMGKVSDAEGAKAAGVSAALWAKERERLGIAAYEGDKDAHLWTPATDKLLGTVEDDALGKKWGRDGESVRRRRIKLGIAAYRAKGKWTPDRVQVLLDEPDNEAAAALLGVSVNTVKIKRSRLKPQ